MKTLVDDFSVLAVEKCLVKRLPDLLSPKTIAGLDDTTITNIAAETEESRLERSRATEKLKVLESTLLVLRSLDMHKPAGEYIYILPPKCAPSITKYAFVQQQGFKLQYNPKDPPQQVTETSTLRARTHNFPR